jgi:hypothetical protein
VGKKTTYERVTKLPINASLRAVVVTSEQLGSDPSVLEIIRYLLMQQTFEVEFSGE